MNARVQVFGPAYLDRVLRVDRPLLDRDGGPPLDQSVEGRPRFGAGSRLELVDPLGTTLSVTVPDDWPGTRGGVELGETLAATPQGVRTLRAESWADDLGGMGAGFASALGGTLVSALGGETDPTSQAVAALLGRCGIAHRCLRESSIGRPTGRFWFRAEDTGTSWRSAFEAATRSSPPRL